MGFWDFFASATPGGAVSETAKAVTDSMFSGVDKLVRDFKAPPEAILQLETLKTQIQAQIQQAIFADIASARAMEVATRSKMPALLTMFYTGAFILLSAGLLYASYAYPAVALSAFQAGMVGAIWGAMAKEAALASTFYLGSSASSSDKNDIIASLAKPPDVGK